MRLATTAAATIAMAFFGFSVTAVAALPQVLSPADGATVNPATDAIVVSPYADGELFECISFASSPVTDAERFGAPVDATNQKLHFFVIAKCSIRGGTIFPLASDYLTAPGTYYYRLQSIEQVGSLWGPIRSFVVPVPAAAQVPPPPASGPTPPAAPPAGPASPALCANAKHRVIGNLARLRLVRDKIASTKSKEQRAALQRKQKILAVRLGRARADRQLAC